MNVIPRLASASVVMLTLCSDLLGIDVQSITNDSKALDLLFSGKLNDELVLVPEQVGALRVAADRWRKALNERSNPQHLSNQNKRPSDVFFEITEECNRAAFAEIDDILLPNQVRRWRQVLLQLAYAKEPMRAILSPRFADQLKLTPGQRDALKKEFEHTETSIAIIVNEMRAQRDLNIRETFNPQQRRQMDDLLGPPFRQNTVKR
jgi:hypothetical protein